MSIVCTRGENCHRRNCFHAGAKVCDEILKLKTPSSFSPLEILYSFTVNFFVMRELSGIGLFKKTCVKAEKCPDVVRRNLLFWLLSSYRVISASADSCWASVNIHRGNVSKRQYL